jgi:hypothetical protein
MLACTFGCKSQQDNSFSRGVGPMLTATVVNYDSGVEWDQYDDESFDVRDQLQLAVAPDDRPLIVSLSPHELPDDSPFRIAGTRFTFQPDKPLTTETQLFCGALNRPTVLGSNGH